MAYSPSILDCISEALAEPMRKLSDVSVSLMGYSAQLLRITATDMDVNGDGFGDLLGDESYAYSSQVVHNVIVNFPFSEVDLLLDKDTTDQSADAMFIDDLLPIEITIPFAGDQQTEPVDLDANDILCVVLFDYKGNKLPVILQAPKTISGFMGRYEVQRKYEATLFRGQLESELQTKVDDFIASLGDPAIESTVPATGATSVDVSGISGSLWVNFDLAMYQSSVESALSFTPSISTSGSLWDSDSKQWRLLLDGDLTSGTLYSGTISTDALSEGRMALDEEYTWTFTTQE